jgi:hypothetical protein
VEIKIFKMSGRDLDMQFIGVTPIDFVIEAWGPSDGKAAVASRGWGPIHR